MPQNKMPMPMPEHSEMANQRKKAEVGFCVPSAYAYAPNRRTDDAEGEQHDKEAEKHRSPPKILDNLVLQQVHEADKGLRKRDGAHDKRKNG